MPKPKIEPFYFSTSDKPLFGCYHHPQSRLARQCGVILCYPMGQEYIRSHRSFQQLAVRLANAGFHVLRFDFYGCGDSAGDFDQGGIRKWLADISIAIRELKRRCGSIKICLVGLRIGATLSMIVGAERDDIDCLVLWDPVVNGTSYAAELKALHKKMLRYFYVDPKLTLEGENYTEILGFPFADSVIRDIEKIDLLTIRQKPANHVLLIESNGHRAEGGLRDHLSTIVDRLEYRHLPSPQIWLEEPYTGLVPHQLLQVVTLWISGVCP